MDRDHVKEWLVVAMREVMNMRPSAFRAGCDEARRTCTHHGQIVPTITNGTEAQSWKAVGASVFLPQQSNTVRLSDSREVQGLIEQAARECAP